MSKRDWKRLVEDMLESIERIQQYTRGISGQEFAKNQMVVDAVVRNLEIIGEAANHLPAEIIDRFPEIPWYNIIGLRNRVIHEYFGVDTRIIWHIVEVELSDVKAKLEKLLA
jgi:uncharacterized protein with HEPN domain